MQVENASDHFLGSFLFVCTKVTWLSDVGLPLCLLALVCFRVLRFPDGWDAREVLELSARSEALRICSPIV